MFETQLIINVFNILIFVSLENQCFHFVLSINEYCSHSFLLENLLFYTALELQLTAKKLLYSNHINYIYILFIIIPDWNLNPRPVYDTRMVLGSLWAFVIVMNELGVFFGTHS